MAHSIYHIWSRSSGTSKYSAYFGDHPL